MNTYFVLSEFYGILNFIIETAFKIYGFYTLILLNKSLMKYLKSKNQEDNK